MNVPVPPPYRHTPLFPLGEDQTTYRKLDYDGVRIERALGRDMVVVSADALRLLAEAAFVDINHLLRPSYLRQLRAILDDPEATENDKFVAYDLLKNANIAAGGCRCARTPGRRSGCSRGGGGGCFGRKKPSRRPPGPPRRTTSPSRSAAPRRSSRSKP